MGSSVTSYVGSRDAEIRAVLAEIATRCADRGVDFSFVPAGALHPVADDPQNLAAQVNVPGAEADGLNGRMVEHERQSRLRRWQEQRTG